MANTSKEASKKTPRKNGTKGAKATWEVPELKELFGLLKENDITEFKLERGDEKLWLRRGPEPVAPQVVVPQMIEAPKALPAERRTPVPSPSQVTGTPATLPETQEQKVTGTPSTPASEPPASAAATNMLEIKSPMVGTFYRRPSVDADPYVQVGDRVKKGDVLCIVEAMKIMNEIEAETSGLIAEICVEDAQMAEYGEVLFRIQAD